MNKVIGGIIVGFALCLGGLYGLGAHEQHTLRCSDGKKNVDVKYRGVAWLNDNQIAVPTKDLLGNASTELWSCREQGQRKEVK